MRPFRHSGGFAIRNCVATLVRALALTLATAAGFGAASARAEIGVQILATDPASPATLGQWQRFSLHIGYTSDRPIRIRAQPFFAGKPVPAINGGSPRYDAGTGEALFWLAFTDPRQVDTIRVTAEAPDGKVIARTDLPVNLTWTGKPAATPAPPEWVTRMMAEREQRSRAEAAAFMEGPSGWLMDAIALAMMAAIPVYLLLQLWLPWYLTGGWRKAATVPLWLMLPVLAYTVYAFLDGSNLFPIVLIFTAPLALAYLLLVMGMARFSRTAA